MELDYKTSVSFSSRFERDAISEFRSLLYDWLRDKNLRADDLDLGVTKLSSNTGAALTRLEQRDGTILERFLMTEVRSMSGSSQTWQTEILAFQHANRTGELLVHINDPRRNTPGNRPGPTGVPGFVRLLLKTTAVSDGQMELGDEPRILDENDEQLVHDLIVDESRRLPLVLAPTPNGRSVDQFAHEVRDMTFGMSGQAGVYILGPKLTQLLEGRTGHLWLPPGGMRLVPPGTDPATKASVAKSYYIIPERIAQRGAKRVSRHWTWLARENSNSLPWPRHMQRLMRTITKHERAVLLDDLDAFLKDRSHPRPLAPRSEVPTFIDQSETIANKRTEDVAVDASTLPDLALEPAVVSENGEPAPPATEELSAEELLHSALIAALPDRDITRELLQVGGGGSLIESLEFALLLAGDYDTMYQQLQAKISAVTSGLQEAEETDELFEQSLEYQEQLRQALADLDEAESRLDREAGAAQWLRRQLMDTGHADIAWSMPQELELAQDFDSILEVFQTLDFISFTGDESITRDLNEMRGSQSTARKTHRALLALHDYARAKAEGNWQSGAFSEYLSLAPAGYATISKSILAPKESEDVSRNPKYRRHRELPMPDGQLVFMEAHIKLSAEATTSPRLHYYDDTAVSGLIVVGYIGAHLPNQQS